jgi:hypothetical protein
VAIIARLRFQPKCRRPPLSPPRMVLHRKRSGETPYHADSV